jgi:hypothetical protein
VTTTDNQIVLIACALMAYALIVAGWLSFEWWLDRRERKTLSGAIKPRDNQGKEAEKK